jgi:hypothetical protein
MRTGARSKDAHVYVSPLGWGARPREGLPGMTRGQPVLSAASNAEPPSPRPPTWHVGNRSRQVFLALGLGTVLLASSVALAGSVHPSTSNAPGTSGGTVHNGAPGNGGCPSSNAIGNFLADPNLTAAFSITGGGTNATYTFSSDNEHSSGGVPGLIAYCVYPSTGVLPNASSTSVKGADGTAFVVKSGSNQGYFSFARGNGDPSNLPLNGDANVSMGNATWTVGAPTNASIVLHINNGAECNALYGGNPVTCFVIPGVTPGQCSTPGQAPASLRIPLPSPMSGLGAGASMTAQYEFEVAGYTSADAGAMVYIPSVFVHFPLTSSGDLALYIAPHVVTVTGSGWTSPIGSTVVVGGPTVFSSTQHGTLSTVSLAVMVAGAPGPLTLEFKWGWMANRSGALRSMWSTPSATAAAPNYPSIFQAAPYVSVLSTTGSPATAGTYFGLTLSGAVTSTTFGVLVEDALAHELHCQFETNSHASGSTFEVGIPLTYANGSPLSPGNYLVHVHDAMGAIVAQTTVTVKA